MATMTSQDISSRLFPRAILKMIQAKEHERNQLIDECAILSEGDKHGQFFFFGDREYTTIKRIFETTEGTKNSQKDNTPYLYWNVMLSAHHCSKAVMYYQDEGDTEECLKKDIMNYFEKYSIEDYSGYIVSVRKLISWMMLERIRRACKSQETI